MDFPQIPWEILGFSVFFTKLPGNPADGSTSFLVCCKMQGPLRQSPSLGANTYDANGFVRLVPHISFETTRGGTWGFGGGGGRYRYR